MTDTKATDIVLWKQWKQMPTPQNLDALMKQMLPVLQREINRWASLAPAFVLENEAKKLAIAAFNSFDPNKGTALATHVTWSLQKLSRVGYKNQSSLSVPEGMRLNFNKYTAAQRHLEDLNGKPPTLEETADYLAVKPKKLKHLIETVGKKEFIETSEGPTFAKDVDDDIIDLAYADMTPIQKRIFEMRTGYNHVPQAKNATQIQKALNITQGQLSYQLNEIKALLEKAQRLR